MSIIIDAVVNHLPPIKKSTPSGWISFNCVACMHNGHSRDTKKRAGVHINDDGISYSCFNCGFKASWQRGRTLNKKFKDLLNWLNVPSDDLIKCIRESLLLKDDTMRIAPSILMPKFFTKQLPLGSRPIKDWIADECPTKLIDILAYMQSRSLFIDDYDWHWSNDPTMESRLIIPFSYHGRNVGYTARTILSDNNPRYMSEQQPGYVFNLDKQHDDRELVILCEGPIDAISIDGIALMGSNLSGGQHLLINQLYKEIILVPDRDESSRKLVKSAIDNKWSVSFPDWEPHIKDINEAARYYGRLYTLYSIVIAKNSYSSKIDYLSKAWFK